MDNLSLIYTRIANPLANTLKHYMHNPYEIINLNIGHL